MAPREKLDDVTAPTEMPGRPSLLLSPTTSAEQAVQSGEGVGAAIAQARQVAARNRSLSPCVMPVTPCAGGPPTLMTKAELEPLLAGGQVHRDHLVMLSNHSAWQHSTLLPVYDNPESEQRTPMPLLGILDLVRHGVVGRVGV